MNDSPSPSFEQVASLVKNKTRRIQYSYHQFVINLEEKIPKLIANPIGDGDIMKLGHDCLGRGVHQVKGSTVIGLLEIIFGA